MCFVQARKPCGRHSSANFARRMETLANLSLVYENMGYIERSIWRQERMIGFVNRLLLDSWTENEFRKRTRVTHIICKFLCKMLGPYLKNKYSI